MFIKTLKPTKVSDKYLKQLRKQLISELNLGPRFNSVHSLWGEITDFHFFKALNDKFRAQFFSELYFYTIPETQVAFTSMHLRFF